MTTTRDPLRLVLDPACPDSQRELLRHGADMAPPPGAEARVWLGVVGAIGGTAAGAAAGLAADASTKTVTTAAKVNVAGLTAAKIVAVVVALAAIGAFGVILATGLREARPPAAPAPAAAPAAETPATAPPPRPAPAEPPPWESPPPARDAQQTTAPGPRRPTPARPRTSAAVPPAAAPSPAARLGEETTLIRDARQALRGGDAPRALRILEDCRRLFPAGVLQQERERLTIEALVRAGRHAEASARAAQFLRKYPDSPHAGDVRALGLGGSGSR